MALDSEAEPDLGVGEASPYAAHLDRGWSLLEQGDTRGARTSGKRAHALLPEDPDACLLLAAAEQSEGRFPAALHWYREAIEVEPDYPEPYLCASQMLIYEQQQYQEAQRLLDETQDLDCLAPVDQAEITLLRAECALGLEQLERVPHLMQTCAGLRALRSWLRTPVQDEPRGIEALVERLAHFHGLDTEEESVELDQDEVDAVMDKTAAYCFRLARIDAELGKVESAAGLLRAILHYVPNHAENWHLLSDCEYRQGKIREAMDAAFKVQALDTQDPVTHTWSDEQMLREVTRLYQELIEQAPLDELESQLKLEMTMLDRPAVELVYEGLDPRALFLVLVPSLEQARPPLPATLVVYRQNLARLIQARDTELSSEVAEALEECLLAQVQEPPATR